MVSIRGHDYDRQRAPGHEGTLSLVKRTVVNYCHNWRTVVIRRG